MSAATKVLFTPELLRMICDFTDRSTCSRMSRHVDGAQNLLTLIKFAIPVYDTESESLVSIVFDSLIAEYINSADLFERFDLYARYVKTLNIIGRDSCYYSLDQNTYYVLCLKLGQRASRSLLPNLYSFELASNEKKHNHRCWDFIRWIKLLGTNKIGIVTMRSDGPSADWSSSVLYIQTLSILGSLASHCPNVQTLSLYSSCDAEFPPLALGSFNKDIRKLNKLKSLSVGEERLCDATILALGDLPELTFLEFVNEDLDTSTSEMSGALGDLPVLPFLEIVNTNQNLDTSTSEMSGDVNELLSATAFQKLDTLRLDTNLTHQIYVLGLQKMVRHVENLHLFLDFFPNSMNSQDPEAVDLESEESKDLLQRELLPSFANMPNLKSLKVEMWDPNCGIDDYDPLPVEIPDFLDAISLPQLELVMFDDIHFGSRILERNLGSIWPQLTSLTLLYQEASLEELEAFATIPNLCFLVVSLKLTTEYRLKPISRTKYAPLDEIRGSRGSEISSQPEVINHTAQGLLYLWPTIRSVNLFADESGEFLSATDKLNERLSSLSPIETDDEDSDFEL
ncbi:hypothetical protein CTheo_7579 [Ceratobasidium theobromae]|uniref:Uncharacterized protein n=1 Tax=Ceratobasidium theobromae TaxID=1582974 RepID=A0A5N5QBE5_9AGAM|nr:hypothetical protein CTheo_7579 [Ceratobasidium theobromae]